jgi:hypothetical protein
VENNVETLATHGRPSLDYDKATAFTIETCLTEYPYLSVPYSSTMSSEMPPGAAPPVPSPEYMAETRGPIISGVTWLAVVLPLVVVSLRLYTRAVLRKVFGVDDYLICVAMVSTVHAQDDVL